MGVTEFHWTLQDPINWNFENLSAQETRTDVYSREFQAFGRNCRLVLAPRMKEEVSAGTGMKMRRTPVVGLFVEFCDACDLSQEAHVFEYRLTIRNQKDDNLSISMDEVADFSQTGGSPQRRFGFETFMTLDLLKDVHAGYMNDSNIIVHGVFRRVDAIPEVISEVRDTQTIKLCAIFESDLKSHLGIDLFDASTVAQRNVSARCRLIDVVDQLSKDHTWIQKEQFVLYNARCKDGISRCARITSAELYHGLDCLEHAGDSLQLIFLKQESLLSERSKRLFVKVHDESLKSFKYAGCYTVHDETLLRDLYINVMQSWRLSRGDEIFGWREADGGLKPLMDSKPVRLSGLHDGSTLYLRGQRTDAQQVHLLLQKLQLTRGSNDLRLEPFFLTMEARAPLLELLDTIRVSSPAASEAGTRLLLCDHDVATNSPAATLLWDDSCAQTQGRTSNSILHLLARQRLGREKFGFSHKAPYMLYMQVLKDRESIDTTIAWYGPKATRELAFTVTLSTNTCLDDIMRKLRQMAPVRGAGDLRLLAVHDHRILHFFQDSDEIISFNPDRVTLRAEEVAGDDYSAQLPHQYVEFRRIASRLDLSSDQLSLHVVGLGATIKPLADRAALFSQHDLGYGDFVGIEIRSDRVAEGNNARLEEASENILKAANTSNVGYLMQYPDDALLPLEAKDNREEPQSHELDIDLVKRSLENQMKQFASVASVDGAESESFFETIRMLEVQLSELQSVANDKIERLETQVDSLTSSNLQERIEELLAVNASMELQQEKLMAENALHRDDVKRNSDLSPLQILDMLLESDMVNISLKQIELMQNVPDGFRCPITQEVMRDPHIVAETGLSYEKSAIVQWLQDHNTDPLTNLRLKSKQIIPNHGLRATIEEFLTHQE
ncbi:hypothetical protein GUITHDRAFT_136887 [Guillardia theta CCMP2712]|uniref:U-box domain-containing protein n=1 Tax=Guillardia theta (strain CCMP2712) TaxID=905079 RepID=L1JJA5_GUITC|nr:hypothetical protein GUITHDRAFT_136887 [Guillardia theta CCMP2712]EKX48382.1 hypothetical protein GUITHDRAFT_136887 [Guillardia theta CCMP2712]|eukprot:XP_005835362.1 hypothetical protein GUITHDRAFT_136887 [Guillardia theta CCMP2712]